MSLVVKKFELLSNPEDFGVIIQNYPAGDTTPVAGMPVQLNSSGKVVIGTAIASHIGIALNTPTEAEEMVAVLRKGKIRINDSSHTLVYTGEEIAATNGMLYIRPDGQWSNTSTSTGPVTCLLVGICTKLISSTTDTNVFEGEINFETASVQPTA